MIGETIITYTVILLTVTMIAAGAFFLVLITLVGIGEAIFEKKYFSPRALTAYVLIVLAVGFVLNVLGI